MWSLLNALSDRDYYDPPRVDWDDEPDICGDWGAGGIGERPARIGAQRIAQCRNRYRQLPDG